MTGIVTSSAEETVECGRILGKLLQPEDFIALVGDLGSGKTQLVKGIALGLGVTADEPVTSPTYTILNVHHGRIPLYHFDLYRLEDESQIADLGFEDYFFGTGVSVVEWAERLGGLNPEAALLIRFTAEGDERRFLTFHPSGVRAEETARLFFNLCPYKSV